jgi:hypothetical protein
VTRYHRFANALALAVLVAGALAYLIAPPERVSGQQMYLPVTWKGEGR